MCESVNRTLQSACCRKSLAQSRSNKYPSFTSLSRLCEESMAPGRFSVRALAYVSVLLLRQHLVWIKRIVACTLRRSHLAADVCWLLREARDSTDVYPFVSTSSSASGAHGSFSLSTKILTVSAILRLMAEFCESNSAPRTKLRSAVVQSLPVTVANDRFEVHFLPCLWQFTENA